ncbi:hypothetical protein OPT61_g116 [Boeremia exigua]|uniref:Uncharacterized protein n=1 Tax=Boeremia exigua TaxID=749465 RepID=A0ACC2IUX1_9PLEO|nr:hypothetical protein OPT61_g116 [Boeremia exigua]
MPPPAKKPSKPIFKTSSPFTETKCLLAPLGEHRKTHIQPSKGKKRKRDTKSPPDAIKPPIPVIGPHILVGLNSVTRHLEALAASTAPPSASIDESTTNEHDRSVAEDGRQSKVLPKPLSFIVLTHPQPSLSPSHAHIPTLVHLATLRPHSEAKSSESTRLVTLPTSHDARYASSLHIPRVGAIGIYSGAPGAKALEEYVRSHVGLTQCPWVDEALNPEWRGLNVQQARAV